MTNHNHEIAFWKISDLRGYERNARTHSQQQVEQLAASIKRFGWTNPLLISEDGEIIAGHGRLAAAQHLGLANVPCIVIEGLTPEERRAYVLADNKLAENAGWDHALLRVELADLKDADELLSVAGFTGAEVDLLLNGWEHSGAASNTAHDDSPLLARIVIRCDQDKAATVREAIVQALRGMDGVNIDG